MKIFLKVLRVKCQYKQFQNNTVNVYATYLLNGVTITVFCIMNAVATKYVLKFILIKR